MFAHSRVTPAWSQPKACTPFCTHFMTWSSSFSHLVETYNCNAFPSKLFAVFQDSFLQWSAYPLVWSWIGFFWLDIAMSDLLCMWRCETNIRTSVEKLDKDLGCNIPCPTISCYMRGASSVTASWIVHRGTIGATTRKAWNQWHGSN